MGERAEQIYSIGAGRERSCERAEHRAPYGERNGVDPAPSPINQVPSVAPEEFIPTVTRECHRHVPAGHLTHDGCRQ